MDASSTETAAPHNGRFEPNMPGSGGPSAPSPTMTGTVEFSLDANPADGSISLTLVEPNPACDQHKRLVGTMENGDTYVRVPRGEIVQIDFVLGGPWKWSFSRDKGGITLATAEHATRYWLVDSPDAKTRRVIIKSSGKPEVADPRSTDNDEKFNLEVKISQAAGSPLAIEVDPITKNPPPGGG